MLAGRFGTRRLALAAAIAAVAAASVVAQSTTPARTVALEAAPAGDLVILGDPATDVALGRQVLVDARDEYGRTRDATRECVHESSDMKVATVSATGLVTAHAAGQATLTITYSDSVTAPIKVTRRIIVDASKPRPTSSGSKPVALELRPASRSLPAPTATAPSQQQLLLEATFADGTREDLTRTLSIIVRDPKILAPSTAGDATDSGLFTAEASGTYEVVAEMPRHALVARTTFTVGAATAARAATTSTATTSTTYSGAPLAGSNHPLDKAALAILSARGIEPAKLSGNAEFLRRVTLDLVGRVPTEAEVDAFLASPGRAALVDRLVASPEFARYWARTHLGPWITVGGQLDAGGVPFDEALANAIASDVPLTEIVKQLATGAPGIGAAFDVQHVSFKTRVDRLMESFAGRSTRCANCHDHPFTTPSDDPRITQADNYGLYAFLTDSGYANPVGLDGRPKIDPVTGRPIRIAPAFVVDGYSGAPAPPPPTATLAARRQAFGDLLGRSDAFGEAMAHRIWAELSAPLLDPNDFLAAKVSVAEARTPGFLAALARSFRNQGSSLKRFVRSCVLSKLYQLTTQGTTAANDRFLARHVARRLHAEQLDASLATFARVAYAPNATFLRDFGCPIPRDSIRSRSDEVNVLQPLVLMNGPGGLRRDLREAAKLAAAVDAGTITRAAAVRSLFKRTLGRSPTADESQRILDRLSTVPTAVALEDVAISLTSSIEYALR